MPAPIRRDLTISEIRSFTKCPEFHRLKYRIGWRIKVINPTSLFGTLEHRGLEEWYLYLYQVLAGLRKPLHINDIRSRVHGVMKSIITDYYGKHHSEIEAYGKYGWEDYNNTLTLACTVFDNYVTHYTTGESAAEESSCETATDPVTSEPMVEFEFRIPIYTPNGNPGRLYWHRGKIDRAVWKNDGSGSGNRELWIHDHKTRASITGSEQDRLILDQQARSYCFGIQTYTGIPVAGFCYDVIAREIPKEPTINLNGEVKKGSGRLGIDAYIAFLAKQDAYLKSLPKGAKIDYGGKKYAQASKLDWAKYEDDIERNRNIKFFSRVYQRYTTEDYQKIQHELYEVSRQLHECRYPYMNDLACDEMGGCSMRAICMGLDPASIYTLGEAGTHSELNPKKEFHLPLGRPYVVEVGEVETMGMEGILNAVNA